MTTIQHHFLSCREEQDIPCLLLQRVARLRPLSHLNSDYMFLLLSGRNFINYLAPIFTGISVPHISPEQIRSFRVCLPSPEEQNSIVNQVTSSMGDLDRKIAS